MAIKDVSRHDVHAQAIEQALDDIDERVRRRWHTMQFDAYTDADLQAQRDDLLDYVAARTVADDPALGTGRSHVALRTAAECALGYLELGSYPNGDQTIDFPLVGESISSEDTHFADAVEHASTAKDWLDAFALNLISGTLSERDRGLGVGLLAHASTIRDGVPHSKLESVSAPEELAEMDVLACYLAPARGHLPRDWPSVTLRMPEIDERLDGALLLNALDAMTADQRLLRVLLEDDQQAFEQALAHSLARHRDNASSDAAPRSLLPHKTIALAAVATQVHGWDLRVRSAYLPQSLLGTPERAASVGG